MSVTLERILVVDTCVKYTPALHIGTAGVPRLHGMFHDTCQAVPITHGVKGSPSGHCVDAFEHPVTAHVAVLRHRVARASKHEGRPHHAAPWASRRWPMCNRRGSIRGGR